MHVVNSTSACSTASMMCKIWKVSQKLDLQIESVNVQKFISQSELLRPS